MKKTYKKPELKQVELKRRANLLECSDGLNCGEFGFNQTPAGETSPKA
ncbi:MAG: hypothetical protein MJY99_12660 [Fibrobacter sp.]|nr:hypothetical protein [Fibrobacter sp.]